MSRPLRRPNSASATTTTSRTASAASAHLGSRSKCQQTTTPETTSSYLSGVLIGHEVSAALADGVPQGPIHLAGSATLTRSYALAFGAFGLDHRLHDPDLVLRGLVLIAETLP